MPYIFKNIPYRIIFKSMDNVNGAVSHSYAPSCFTPITCISFKLVQSFEEICQWFSIWCKSIILTRITEPISYL